MKVTVDGVMHGLDGADPASSLGSWLRDVAGVTAVKIGCAEGACGACVVLVDGYAVPSCLVPLGRADGADVATVVTVSDTEFGGRLVEELVAQGGVQCGFCTPGIVCAAAGLARRDERWTEAEVREALGGHLCRCTGYFGIIRAVCKALEGSAA